MDVTLAEVVLFIAAAVSALIDAVRRDIFPKVGKLALAVAFAATGFALLVGQKL